VAGDWIKMRGALLEHPKVIAVTRVLQQNREFREWLVPGGGKDMDARLLSTPASRAVTTALLLRAWSAAREHGKFLDDDLWLEHSWVEDLDQMAGAPGVGLAMEAVGWVRPHPTAKGVILPNFKEFNVPMTEAERAHNYRQRKKNTENGVTQPSRKRRDEKSEIVTTRVEKSRDIPVSPNGDTAAAPIPPADDPKREAWRMGRQLLADVGVSRDRAGAFLGRLARESSDAVLIGAIHRCARERPADPKSWLMAACRQPGKQAALEARNRDAAAAFVAGGDE